MPAPYLCTVEDIKTLFPAAGRYDTHIANAREAAQTLILTYLRRNLAYGARSQTFATMDNPSYKPQVFWLDDTPIDPAATFSVYYSTARLFDEESLLPNTEYEYKASNSKLTLFYRTLAHPSALKVVYSAGYDFIYDEEDPPAATEILNVPTEIRMACYQQAAFMVQRSIEREEGQEAKKKGAAVMQAEAAARAQLLPEVRILLNPYRRQLGGVI